MCIAILNTNKKLTHDQLLNSYLRNPDGAGLMWSDGKYLQTYVNTMENGMDDFYDFVDMYNKAWIATKFSKATNASVGVHFRLATHGAITEENTHPFLYTAGGEQIAIMHNGILSGYDRDHSKSDTQAFVERFLERNQLNPFAGKHHQKAIEAEVKRSGYNKVVFMDSRGETFVAQEHLGNYEGGSWFSNYGYASRYGYAYSKPYSKYAY